ncbi:glycosyltransferase family 2 protein [Candidatus Roizmanbacteria bacterium]|jgi:glycosyltransferase involved in cell wall biosynthesis|nr:glycosyltransferase family 2 protein [Candidatus Roizmanbacteria bacterium]
MNPQITAIIHTRNEEDNIASCVKSARLLTDKIIVIDMQSQDKTVDLAKKLGCELYSFPFVQYVEPARKFAIEKAKTDWIFILDGDERITPALATEIKITVKNRRYTYYKVPRKNIFNGSTGKWLKHGGWWPDYQTRLISRSDFVDWPEQIHSTPKIKGDCGLLKQSLTHYFHGEISKMVDKTVVFEEIESELLFKAGRPAGTFIFFRKFFGELYRRLIGKIGFADGTAGIIESVYQAFSKTITYLYLYEKKKSRPV